MRPLGISDRLAKRGMNGPERRFHIQSEEVSTYTIRQHPRGRSAIHAALSPRAHSGYELGKGTLFGSLARPRARIRSPLRKGDRKGRRASPGIIMEPGRFNVGSWFSCLAVVSLTGQHVQATRRKILSLPNHSEQP